MFSPNSAFTRWAPLAVLSLTQLVIVLDGTIVNVALPQAQAELGLSDVERQWVVTAYVLAFGALLLLGGRIADYWGRRRTYLVGMLGFGVASALGGLAQTGMFLIVARGFQGAFAALLAPAALALLTVTFPRGRERNTAFAVFGTLAGAGSAVGMVLGGILTEFADWRWCLLVNVFFVAVGLVGGVVYLTESKASGDHSYDIAGAVTVTLGFGSLVYGFSLAENGWTSLGTLGFLALGLALIVAFVIVEARSRNPLLPLRVVTDAVRGASFLIQGIIGIVMIGSTLYLALHLQIVLGFSPLQAGLASVPTTLTIIAVAPIATRWLHRVGPRPLLVVGPLVAASGLFYLSFVTADGNYLVQVLPGLLLLGAGMSTIFVPVQNLSLIGVEPRDAGAASAAANSAMQLGGSIGLSVFTAISVAVTAGATPDSNPLVGIAEGFGVVFLGAAISMVVAAVLAISMIRGTKEKLMPQH